MIKKLKLKRKKDKKMSRRKIREEQIVEFLKNFDSIKRDIDIIGNVASNFRYGRKANVFTEISDTLISMNKLLHLQEEKFKAEKALAEHNAQVAAETTAMQKELKRESMRLDCDVAAPMEENKYENRNS